MGILLCIGKTGKMGKPRFFKRTDASNLWLWCGYDAGCIHAVFGKLCADMDCRSDWGNGSGIHNRMGDGEDV